MSIKNASSQRFKYFKKFLPFLAIGAFLPVLLFAALMPEKLNWFKQAEQSDELRIWLEPQTLILNPNQVYKLRVMAEFTASDKIMPSLSMVINSENGLSFAPSDLTYPRPFRGKVKIGEVTVFSPQPGTYRIDVPSEKIITDYSRSLNKITSFATIIVQ